MKSRRRPKKAYKKKAKVRTSIKKRGGEYKTQTSEDRRAVMTASAKRADEIDKNFKDWIRTYVKNDNSDQKDIITKYTELVASIETESNDRVKLNLKNIINNLIEYAESAVFKKLIKEDTKIKDGKQETRRLQIIDQFTRLNTTPYVDPYLDRIITTFWPEFDAINYKPPQTNILKKTTKYVSDFYDNDPVHDPKSGAEETPGTYSHREMRQYDDYNGDKMVSDAFGVEETLNMLMHTGSNLSWALRRKPTYTEEYKQKEKIDVSKMMKTELV